MNGECLIYLDRLGISPNDAIALRRIAMTLHRWHEMECGTDSGAIERDGPNGDGKPFWRSPLWYNTEPSRRWDNPVPDREAGALKRLTAIMARYPQLGFYVQGDPRGAPLYILRPGDIPAGEPAESFYNRGIAVYK